MPRAKRRPSHWESASCRDRTQRLPPAERRTTSRAAAATCGGGDRSASLRLRGRRITAIAGECLQADEILRRRVVIAGTFLERAREIAFSEGVILAQHGDE